MIKATRQAIVVIHGIGEQKPMSTLRGFVKSLLAAEQKNFPEDDDKKKYWSKPDPMSRSFELRKIVTKSNKQRVTTNFFEYYWAANMRKTTFGHVLPWLTTLLLVNPKRVPRRLAVAWMTSWFLMVLTIYFALSGVFEAFQLFRIQHSSIFSVGGVIVSAGLQVILNKYIGDAARYLTPSPANIAERHEIRKQGIELVKRLHESGEYDRIIIVGHSLGSVIGYDIIKHLWSEYNSTLINPIPGTNPKQPELNKMEEFLNLPGEIDEHKFRKQQAQLLKEQQEFSNPWMITDFVTVGSPLAHAGYLLAQSDKDLHEQFDERILPTCPPKMENGEISYPNYYENSIPEKRLVKYLHHAAPFACTRWTNLYYPGDLVGGPIAPLFGNGVEDIVVKLAKPYNFLSYLPTCHTKYWRDTITQDISKTKEFDAISTLYKSLKLDELKKEKA